MNRRRTAAVVLAVSAVTALSACSSTAHPGAAAVVGDQRITVSTLQAHVNAYRAAVVKDGTVQEQAGVPGHTLWLLVTAQVVDQALAQQGLSVPESAVQQQEAGYLQQFGSPQALQQAIVSKLSIAPADFEAYVRLEIGQGLLIKQSGVDPSSSGAAAALMKIMKQTSADIGVTVNPRYGSWDATSQQGLAPARQPWLKPIPAAPAA